MTTTKKSEEVKYFPQIDKILQHPIIKQLEKIYNKYFLHLELKDFVNQYRKGIYTLHATDKKEATDEIAQNFYQHWNNITDVKLKKVYNATGTILHTNLGRAPLSNQITHILPHIVESYLNLEIDENTHKRVKRERFVMEKIKLLTGTEFAVFVNNNAGAIFLLLKSLAENKEVIISRSELIEIGEGFRIPQIMKESGAKLVEVGTTNRTYLSDYEQAITPQTALIFKAHQSNFYQKGFTMQPDIQHLSALSKKYNIPLIYDIGSGFLYNIPCLEIKEPTVTEAIKKGADIVLFSADKLLGGPQAGILIGKKDILEKIRKHPLYRTYRLDKISLLLLEKILSLYFLNEEKIIEIIPHFKLMTEDNHIYTEKLHPFLEKLPSSIKWNWIKKTVKIGGGSSPAYKRKSLFLKLSGDTSSLINTVKNFPEKIFYKVKDGALYFHITYLNAEVISKLLEHLSSNYQNQP